MYFIEFLLIVFLFIIMSNFPLAMKLFALLWNNTLKQNSLNIDAPDYIENNNSYHSTRARLKWAGFQAQLFSTKSPNRMKQKYIFFFAKFMKLGIQLNVYLHWRWLMKLSSPCWSIQVIHLSQNISNCICSAIAYMPRISIAQHKCVSYTSSNLWFIKMDLHNIILLTIELNWFWFLKVLTWNLWQHKSS